MATDQQYAAATAAIVALIHADMAQVPFYLKGAVSSVPDSEIQKFAAAAAKAAVDAAAPKGE